MNNEIKICLSCGEEISSKRMRANPRTSLCTDCKKFLEEEKGCYRPPRVAISLSYLFVWNVPDHHAPEYASEKALIEN